MRSIGVLQSLSMCHCAHENTHAGWGCVVCIILENVCVRACLCVCMGACMCVQSEVSLLRGEVAQLKTLLLAHQDCPITLQQKSQGQLALHTSQSPLPVVVTIEV